MSASLAAAHGGIEYYSYDQNGQGTKTFSYDLAGMLTQVYDNSTTLAHSPVVPGLQTRLAGEQPIPTPAEPWIDSTSVP